MAETLRVVIAEDNYLVREGVRRLLEDSGQVEVMACVGDTVELPIRCATQPNAVLTDVRIPAHMRSIRPPAPSVRAPRDRRVVSQHTDESYTRALFGTGPQGWRTCSRSGR